ncbi:MAG: hypothetical protein QM756_29445 [Polyangiaceae bacterium]
MQPKLASWVALGVSVFALGACKKSEPAPESGAVASAAVGAATPAGEAPAAPGVPAAAGAALAPGAFDTCLVGKWKSDKVTLKMDQVSAEGGAGVALEIAATGASNIDFSPMSEVNAKTQDGVGFNFKYSGKASATLKTPSAGNIDSENNDFAALKVTVAMKMPGAGGASIPILKDVAISELATMGAALGGKGLPKVPGVGAGMGSMVDANPVFSRSQYTCQGDSLSFKNVKSPAEWVFTRVH